MRIQELLDRLFPPSVPPPNIDLLIEEGLKARDASAQLVEDLDQQHAQHVREQRRRDPAEAIRHARQLREQAR